MKRAERLAGGVVGSNLSLTVDTDMTKGSDEKVRVRL
jgi:hypothetical protein